MTTEQDNQRVSDAYRDIATQTTPADLDETVLRLAVSAEPSRYGLARAWVRPLAWAATIALSLAFVLELSQLEDARAPALPKEMREQPAEPELPGRSDADLMKAKEEKDVQHGIAAKRAPAAAPVPAVVDAEDMAPLQSEAEETVRLQSAGVTVEEVAVSGQRAAAEASADEPAVAASRARTNMLNLAPPDEEGHCDNETRASAENWYACIVALREEGLTDAADSELEALRKVFPDFDEGRE
jgi:cell division protein FtsN